MVRMMEMTFPEKRVRAVVEFLEDDAPDTCDFVWKYLENPIEAKIAHASSVGRVFFADLIKTIPPVEAERLRTENTSVYPLPGDVYYAHLPPRFARGAREGVSEIVVCYGGEVRESVGFGWFLPNIFGKVVENLDRLVEIGSNLWESGPQRVVLRRK